MIAWSRWSGCTRSSLMCPHRLVLLRASWDTHCGSGGPLSLRVPGLLRLHGLGRHAK
jgi:hypothetical protein